MKRKYIRQAKQLYKALKQKGQTWTRTRAQLTGWAVEFQEMREDEEISAKRIQRVLDWYCQHGIGAIYVPIACTGESFREKFDDIDEARKRLKGQPLRYFDDVLNYRYSVYRGTPTQREYRKASEKVQQQVELVDDLAHGRAKLPKEKKRKAATERPTKKQQRMLRRLLIIDREILWSVLMDVPGAAASFDRQLVEARVHRRWRRFLKRSAAVEEAPF